jgi:hypothetical protein
MSRNSLIKKYLETPWGRLEICKKSAEFQEIHQHLRNSKGGGVQKMDVLHRRVWIKNAISHYLFNCFASVICMSSMRKIRLKLFSIEAS